jgi:hypothetical protein
LTDGIRETGTSLREELGEKCEILIGDGEGHIEFILDFLLGYEKGVSARGIESWICSRLSETA